MKTGQLNQDMWLVCAAIMLFLGMLVYTLSHIYSLIAPNTFSVPVSSPTTLALSNSEVAPSELASYSYDLFTNKSSPLQVPVASVMLFPDVRLIGVIATDRDPVALLQNESDQYRQVYGIGQLLKGYDDIRIAEINAESVVLSQGEAKKKLFIDRPQVVDITSSTSSGELVISNVH